jgi:hypothetical protein
MGYIVGNISNKQYIRPEAFGEMDTLQAVVGSQEGVMFGLVVLLADGNNRGGGDLRSDAAIIGAWAGDRIVLLDETALMPEASEPGMEAVPMQQQLLKLGQDVSAEVISAILDAEGGDSRLAGLNPHHKLPLTAQADLQSAGGGELLTQAGRSLPFHYLEEVFCAFSVSMAPTKKAMARALETGINNMAQLLGRDERYAITHVSTQNGEKTARLQGRFGRPGDPEPVQGVTNVTLTLSLVNNPTKSREIVIALGTEGTSRATLYEALFPGIVFERTPVITVRTPEVARLLSFLPQTEI